MAYKILIPEMVSQTGYQFLIDQGYEVTMEVDSSEENLIHIIGEYDGLLARNARYPRAVIEAGKKLKVIGRHGTGVDNVDVKAAQELGIWVVNAPTANINAVAEQTIAFMMALCCEVVQCDRMTRQGDWIFRNGISKRRSELAGKTLALVGLGRIGALVAQKASLGLGMRVIAYDPYARSCPPNVELCGDLPQLLAQADYLSLHTPATAETCGMMNRETFAQMKPTAFFIDCARGELYEEQALCEALRTHQIAGAAIDVYHEEPPTAENPLFSLDNVIVSQHNAAHSIESVDQMAYDAAVGIHQILTGQTPDFPVNHPENPRI